MNDMNWSMLFVVIIICIVLLIICYILMDNVEKKAKRKKPEEPEQPKRSYRRCTNCHAKQYEDMMDIRCRNKRSKYYGTLVDDYACCSAWKG